MTLYVPGGISGVKTSCHFARTDRLARHRPRSFLCQCVMGCARMSPRQVAPSTGEAPAYFMPNSLSILLPPSSSVQLPLLLFSFSSQSFPRPLDLLFFRFFRPFPRGTPSRLAPSAAQPSNPSQLRHSPAEIAHPSRRLHQPTAAPTWLFSSSPREDGRMCVGKCSFFILQRVVVCHPMDVPRAVLFCP